MAELGRKNAPQPYNTYTSEQQDIIDNAQDAAIATKYTKVTSPVTGNFPSFGAGDVLEDSGLALADTITTSDYIGAVGNINSPTLSIPCINSIAIDKGVGSVTAARTTTATHVDRYGTVKSLAIDALGHDRNGVKIEGESTNYSLHSNDVSTGHLYNNTIRTGGQLSVDGNATAALISLDPTATGNAGVAQNISATVNIGDEITISRIFKYVSTHVRMDIATALIDVYSPVAFDLINGVVGSNPYGLNAAIEELDNRFYRCSVSFVATKASASIVPYYYAITDPNNVNTIKQADGASSTDLLITEKDQVEFLPYPSSYIPTTTAPVTRTASLTTATAYDNIPNLNEDWTMEFDLTVNGENTDSTVGQFLSCLNGSDTNSILYMRYINSSDVVQVNIIDDVGVKGLNSSTHTVGDTKRYSCVFNRAINTLYLYVDGIVYTGRADITTLETEATLLKFNGWGSSSVTAATPFISLKNIKFYDYAKSAEEVRIS